VAYLPLNDNFHSNGYLAKFSRFVAGYVGVLGSRLLRLSVCRLYRPEDAVTVGTAEAGLVVGELISYNLFHLIDRFLALPTRRCGFGTLLTHSQTTDNSAKVNSNGLCISCCVSGYGFLWKTHCRATEHHMPLAITCHQTRVNAPHRNPRQTGWYLIYLLCRDKRLS